MKIAIDLSERNITAIVDHLCITTTTFSHTPGRRLGAMIIYQSLTQPTCFKKCVGNGKKLTDVNSENKDVPSLDKEFQGMGMDTAETPQMDTDGCSGSCSCG